VRSSSILRALALILPTAAVVPLACSGSGSSGAVGDDAGTDAVVDETDAPDDASPSICDALALSKRAWSAGPYGYHRDEIADDFQLPLHDGTTWSLAAHWTGCESYVFVPDTLAVSALDTTSIWASDVDLASLIASSPKNVHWFFVSRMSTDAAAQTSLDAMQTRVDGALGKLSADDAAHWSERLHVVGKRAGALGGWVQTVLAGHGATGFAVDRLQRVRGIGNLADVKRFDQALQNASQWPWKSNLAYATQEAKYFDYLAQRQDHLDADGATVVPLWNGETIQQAPELDVALPNATDMAKFDTLEIEVDQMCPDREKIEFGNCGAWDYIASLSVETDAGADGGAPTYREIARFITSYHRETHWIVDATPMLALLADGGTKHFKWDFAPSWNVQPTATRLALRFSNQKKPYRPTKAVFLWSGGDFGSGYDALHAPEDVPIPSGAKHVEVWSILTGHGGGTNQCSEFCNHQHQLVVGGTTFLKEFPMAGTQDKCIPEVANGMTPNQGGTWWFGRGGWCPGERVAPWVVDATTLATPGQALHLDYHGLYRGQTPPDGSGNIDLSTYVVVYE
jgi:hypothetical protein